MTTSQSTLVSSKVSDGSPPFSDMKAILRPKELDLARFIPLMNIWLQGRQPLTKAESERLGISRNVRDAGPSPEYVKVKTELMRQLPIKEEQLRKIPQLLPDLTTRFKPPTMRFGWVMSADEIEHLGLLKGQRIELTRLEYYEPEDLPPDVRNAKFEDGVYEVDRGSYFSAEWTADGLLSVAKGDLGLCRKHHGDYPYFTVSNIITDFGQGGKDYVFVMIYSNMDLLPQGRGKAPLPTSEDIKRMQEWLGLKGEDRKPGWWFSMVGLTRTTWQQYWAEGDM